MKKKKKITNNSGKNMKYMYMIYHRTPKTKEYLIPTPDLFKTIVCIPKKLTQNLPFKLCFPCCLEVYDH